MTQIMAGDNRQSAIRQSAIGNRQSVNLQPAICNLQPRFHLIQRVGAA